MSQHNNPNTSTSSNSPNNDEIGEITEVINEWKKGSADVSQLFIVAEREIRKIASIKIHQENRDHTLGTGGLVSELFLKFLSIDPNCETVKNYVNDRQGLINLVSLKMKQILVDYARTRQTIKRGGKGSLDEFLKLSQQRQREGITDTSFTDLKETLDNLTARSPRRGQIAELKIYWGFENEEIADHLNISLTTVKTEWRNAKAWLIQELKKNQSL